MAKYGVIYAAGSKMVRRIVVSDDLNYDYSQHVGDGEEVLVEERTRTRDGKGDDVSVHAARAAVRIATGIEPPEHVCAVVDGTGLVVNMIAADPDLDTLPEHTLVLAYAGVGIGCTYDQATDTFSAPIVEWPAGISPNGMPYEAFTTGGPVPKPPDESTPLASE
jgi:hypothetical protein